MRIYMYTIIINNIQKLNFNTFPENRIQHVLNGGGRFNDYEDNWFYLEEIIR